MIFHKHDWRKAYQQHTETTQNHFVVGYRGYAYTGEVTIMTFVCTKNLAHIRQELLMGRVGEAGYYEL